MTRTVTDHIVEHDSAPVASETAEARAARYERTLRAIAGCTLSGLDFADWVQAASEDVLGGLEPECYNCGTLVHEGPCVGDGDADE